MKRRRFLLFGIGGVLAAGAAVLYRYPPFRLPLSDNKQRFISTLVDRLIPADEISPGGRELGVDLELIEQANSQASFRRLLHNGYDRLNELARTMRADSFIQLGEEGQIQLLTLSEQSPPSSPENRLFKTMRRRCFHSYYAKPASWNGLCYPGPPQPKGHRDYAGPAKDCS